MIKICHIVKWSSHSEGRKVGAILYNPETASIVSSGWNGTPRGNDNTCYIGDVKDRVSKLEVLHAETSAITKKGVNPHGCWLFSTCSPCIECAKVIYQSGITKVFYDEKHWCTTGLSLMDSLGIEVKQIILDGCY